MVVKNASINFGSIEFTYLISRSARKTVGIIVDSDGKVNVRAPIDLDEEEIKEAVFKKRKWIAKKIQGSQEIKKPIPLKRELVSGEKIKLKNKNYRLKIHSFSKKRSKIVFVRGILHIYVNENLNSQEKQAEIKKTLIKWYKKKAKTIISQRVQKYLKYLDMKPKQINLREQKLRWGSCSKTGIINFKWQIVMAPISAIDYIIVHELCHLKEQLHSAKFWDMVESLFPNYKRWKEWLRINGRTLDLRI